MEKIGIMRQFTCESESLLKSSSNIFENFSYEDYKRFELMASPSTFRRHRVQQQQQQQQRPKFQQRSKSPQFSKTIENNLFMQNVINSTVSSTIPTTTTSPSLYRRNNNNLTKDKEISVRRSLEEISKDIKEIEDFLTVTEIIIKRERERDKEFYSRERRRKIDEKKQRKSIEYPNKENKIPTPPKQSPTGSRKNSQKSPTFKINSFKVKKVRANTSPKLYRSKLYFRNGKIGCVEAEQNLSNIESTHALVKQILKYENEKPLVSRENVEKVLNQKHESEELFVQDLEDIEQPQELREHFVLKRQEKIETEIEVKNDDNIKDTVPENLKNDKKKSVDTEAEVLKIEYNESTNEIDDEQANVRYEEKSLESSYQSSKKSEPTTPSHDIENQQFVRERVRHLVRRFTTRTKKMRSRLDLPPTPSSSISSASPPLQPLSSIPPVLAESQKSPTPSKNQLIKIIPSDQKRSQQDLFVADQSTINGDSTLICNGFCIGTTGSGVLDPQGKIYISWLCVVSLTFLYNAWVIPLRSAFPFQTPENTNTWLMIDFCADLIYLLDVVFFKHRVMYLFEGFWVKDKNLTRKNYMRKLQFKLDLLSLTPLDLLYLKYGTNAVYFRFPRFFKIQSFWEVFKLLDRVISSPHFVRVAKTLTYMLYMIHLTACAYYAYSAYQGLGINRWVFSGKGHPYVRCFAFATKTATSIGKNPKPEKEGELVFMTAAWLMGVFVFALLIGQIRDIISTATRSQSEYRELEDETLEYMRRLNLPSEIQRRVKMWFKFTWDQQRTLDESHILDSLPANLKTDIAISVHIQTLSKVQLFADCEEALLRELVLKLRSVTFLPGDYVCRKGEVGREMYIVKLGQVQVMGGPNNDEVLATLSEGSVFGEISLLAINGVEGNRRTADVKSKGFSNLFVLSKSDLNEAIVYYPNAQAILKRRARSLMRKNAAREREEERKNAQMRADVVIGNPKTPSVSPPPKMLRTVIQALPVESPAVILLTKGSKKKRKRSTMTVAEGNSSESQKEQQESENSRSDDQSTVIEKQRSGSPDLLSSIQDELKSKNKLINLTDSEKALIMSSSSSNDECDVVMVHKEM